MILNITPIPLLLAAFTLIISIPLETAQSVPSSCVHMDFVVLLHDAAQKNTHDGHDYSYAAAYKGMIESFAKVFALAVDKTRVSVVALNSEAKYHVLLPFTSNKAQWESALTTTYTFEPSNPPSIQDGLKTVREKVFNDQKAPSKARLILVSTFTDGLHERFGSDLAKEVKSLNNMENMLVLVVTRNSHDHTQTRIISERLYGAFTEDLVFHVPRYEDFIKAFSEDLPAWILDKMNKKLCKTTTAPPKPTSPPATKTTEEDEDDDWVSWAEGIRANGAFQLMMNMVALRLVI